MIIRCNSAKIKNFRDSQVPFGAYLQMYDFACLFQSDVVFLLSLFGIFLHFPVVLCFMMMWDWMQKIKWLIEVLFLDTERYYLSVVLHGLDKRVTWHVLGFSSWEPLFSAKYRWPCGVFFFGWKNNTNLWNVVLGKNQRKKKTPKIRLTRSCVYFRA